MSAVGNQWLCFVAGYELLCLGCPTDVPPWEELTAGCNNYASVLHGIQVS